MKIERKYLVISGVITLVAFALGRYTVSENVKVEEKIVYVEKTDKTVDDKTQVDVDKDKHKVVVVTETTNLDGTKVVTTRTEEVEKEKSITKNDITTKEHTEKETKTTKDTVIASANKVTISALGAMKVTNLGEPPVFGAQVSRPLLGPVVLGVWGLSNATVGISIGLQF